MLTEFSRAESAPPYDGSTVARRIRILTGAREELLGRIPAERTRYTALAAVMICTATIGGLSMFFALSEILGASELWFVLIAAFWTTFILCVDCWLVSSTAGSRWRTRISVLLPRLAVAAVFGIVIAEPLVLRVFQTGIVSHVHSQRQEAIDTLRTALVSCNPVPGITTTHPAHVNCAGATLNISAAAAATAAQLQGLQKTESSLQNQVNNETAQLARLENTVNDECNGVRGHGLSGLAGNGPACHQDQQDVGNYRATHPISAQEAGLGTLNSKIRSLQGSLSGQQTNERSAISKSIAARLKNETQPNATIGMAERFQALTYLSLSNNFIGIASWFVRIFFILIDCLPVLVKFISGSTPYDRLVNIEIASAEKRFRQHIDTQDTIAGETNTTILRRAKADAMWQRQEIDLEIQHRDSEREVDKEAAVNELWRRKLKARGSGQPAGSARYANGAQLPVDPHLAN